jgi:voltage-gated potassium channel
MGDRMRGPELLARRLARWDESRGALGRHSLMLASLVVLLVALPLGNVLSGGDTAFSILLALVLVAAVFVNAPQRWTFFAAAVIGMGSVIGLAASEMSGSRELRIVADVMGLALLGFTTLLMLNSLIYSRRVSADTMVGGICVYLLVGLCFTMMFGLICDLEPDSIVQGGVAIERSHSDISPSAAKLLYFSFVTLTNLGFGDIVPRSEIAQMVTVAEAVIGQLYLAIFVARLVALYVADDRRHRRAGSRRRDVGA